MGAMGVVLAIVYHLRALLLLPTPSSPSSLFGGKRFAAATRRAARREAKRQAKLNREQSNPTCPDPAPVGPQLAPGSAPNFRSLQQAEAALEFMDGGDSLQIEYSQIAKRNGEIAGWLWFMLRSDYQGVITREYPPVSKGPTAKCFRRWARVVPAPSSPSGTALLRLSERPEGPVLQEIDLAGCVVSINLDNQFRQRPKWVRKGPLELSHASRNLLLNETSLIIYTFNGALKEQWFKALRAATEGGVPGAEAGAEAGKAQSNKHASYSKFMEDAAERYPGYFWPLPGTSAGPSGSAQDLPSLSRAATPAPSQVPGTVPPSVDPAQPQPARRGNRNPLGFVGRALASGGRGVFSIFGRRRHNSSAPPAAAVQVPPPPATDSSFGSAAEGTATAAPSTLPMAADPLPSTSGAEESALPPRGSSPLQDLAPRGASPEPKYSLSRQRSPSGPSLSTLSNIPEDRPLPRSPPPPVALPPDDLTEALAKIQTQDRGETTSLHASSPPQVPAQIRGSFLEAPPRLDPPIVPLQASVSLPPSLRPSLDRPKGLSQGDRDPGAFLDDIESRWMGMDKPPRARKARGTRHPSESGAATTSDPLTKGAGGNSSSHGEPRPNLAPSPGVPSTSANQEIPKQAKGRAKSNLPSSVPLDVVSDFRPAYGLNLFFARIFYDLTRNPRIASGFQDKIQVRLDRIPLPSYLGTIKVSNLDLGTTPPVFANVVAVEPNSSASPEPPEVDPSWPVVEASVRYRGNFSMTLETNLRLTETGVWGQLQKWLEALEGGSAQGGSDTMEVTIRGADGLEEEAHLQEPAEVTGPQGSEHQTLLRSIALFLPRIAARGARRMAGNVAQKVLRIQLAISVELVDLEGTIRLWIPPPPSDRLWFAFTQVPKLKLVASPLIDGQPLGNRLLAKRISGFFESRLERLIVMSLVLPACEGTNLPGMIPVDYADFLTGVGVAGATTSSSASIPASDPRSRTASPIPAPSGGHKVGSKSTPSPVLSSASAPSLVERRAVSAHPSAFVSAQEEEEEVRDSPLADVNLSTVTSSQAVRPAGSPNLERAHRSMPFVSPASAVTTPTRPVPVQVDENADAANAFPPLTPVDDFARTPFSMPLSRADQADEEDDVRGGPRGIYLGEDEDDEPTYNGRLSRMGANIGGMRRDESEPLVGSFGRNGFAPVGEQLYSDSQAQMFHGPGRGRMGRHVRLDSTDSDGE